MSDYKPKVGEECEMLNHMFTGPKWTKVTPIFIGNHLLVVNPKDSPETPCTLSNCEFRPIPTKAEAELEELVLIQCKKDAGMNSEETFRERAARIQKAGFTKSKEVEKVSKDAVLISYQAFCKDAAYRDSLIDIFTEWSESSYFEALLGHLIKNAPEDK